MHFSDCFRNLCNPLGSYLVKVKNKNNRLISRMCSKFEVKTVIEIVVVSLLLTLKTFTTISRELM